MVDKARPGRYVKAKEGLTCEWFPHPNHAKVCGAPATICDLEAWTGAPHVYCAAHGSDLCERCDTSDLSPPLPGREIDGEVVCEGCQP